MRFLSQTFARLLPAVFFVFVMAGGGQRALGSGTSAGTGTVLVLPVGNASDVILLQNNAAAPLREAGVGLATLEDAELVGFEAREAVACLDEDGECEHLLRKAPAEWVLLLRISHSRPDTDATGTTPDEDQTVIAKLYEANDGSLLQVDQRLCQRCNSRERMAKLTMELIAEVTKAELATRANQTYINVTSSPVNAVLSIDGTVVGPTGQSYRVSPGEHNVSVSLDGYHAASQTVSVAANENKAITVGLGKERVASGPGDARRILTWGCLGSGVVALGAGVAWVVVDGNATGDNTTGRAEVRDTKTLGVSSLAFGSVLLGTGIALWLTQDDGGQAMQVSPAPTDGGLSVSLRGRF